MGKLPVRSTFAAAVACFLIACGLGIRRPQGAVLPVYPLHGANWNDYVKAQNGGTGLFDQPDVACNGNTENGYGLCIHGGERRKFTVPQKSSCSGLTAADSLGAFDWICDSSSGAATFYSKGLKSGKGLRDLVGAGAFKSNTVTVSNKGVPYFQTTPSVWWSNPVQALPLNSSSSDAALSLSTAGAVYVAANNQATSGYNINADKISVVTLPGITLSYSGQASAQCDFTTGKIGTSTRAFFCAGSQSFLWIEADMNGQSSNVPHYGIYLRSINLSRVHLTHLVSALREGIYLNGTKNVLVDQSAFVNSSTGAFVINSTYNTLKSLNVSLHGGGPGIQFADGGNFNSAIDILSANSTSNADVTFYPFTPSSDATDNILIGLTGFGGNFFSIEGNLNGAFRGKQNTILNATIAGELGVSGGAIHFRNSTLHTVSNIVALNTATDTILYDNSTVNIHSYDLAVYGSSGFAVAVGSAVNNPDGMFFAGQIRQSNNTSACAQNGGTGTIEIANTCFHGPALATAPLAFDPSSSLVGIVNKDTKNASGSSGSAAFNSISDFLNFENPYRYWALSGTGTLFDPSRRGNCAAGQTCQIYDFRVSSSDTVMKNANGAFVKGGACPSSVDGTIGAISDQSGRTFLRNAVEIIGDGIGNDNGLCESGDACIYSPNLGSYQGEGDYTTQSCIFSNGTVTGVTMYAYPVNGG